MKFAPEVK